MVKLILNRFIKNVNVVSFSFVRGGAAKAALRITNAIKLREPEIAFSYTSVDHSSENGRRNSRHGIADVCHIFVRLVELVLVTLLRKSNDTKHSVNWFGCSWVENSLDSSQLNHIHWINNCGIAIGDFHRLSHKSIITLHDEWFYCGAEHYDVDDTMGFVDGYESEQWRFLSISWLVWRYKKYCYASLKDVIFVVPSLWMASRLQQSALLRTYDVRVIPNPIDFSIFQPRPSSKLASELNIQAEDLVVLFGAVAGRNNAIKGFDLLESALQGLSNMKDVAPRVKLVCFGGDVGETELYGFPVISVGKISDEIHLAELYSLATVTVVPSRKESFGQVAAESISCGTPVVAFDTSGLRDILEHEQSGYLACEYDPMDLLKGICWVLTLTYDQYAEVASTGMKANKENFSPKIVADSYLDVYREIWK